MNVLILTVAFLFMFVGGIFVGRELTYLADKRKRKPKVHHKHPPVAAGRLDDKSKHWPADWVPTPQEMGSVMGWADPDVAKEAYVAYVRLFTLNERGGR